MERTALWRSYLLTEMVLYSWFLGEDLTGKKWILGSDQVKYLAIWICFVMAWHACQDRKEYQWMRFALFMSLPADLTLLFYKEWALAGVLLFFCVQAGYYMQLRGILCRHNRLAHAYLRSAEWGMGIGWSVSLLLIHLWWNAVPDLITAATVYSQLLLLNGILAVWADRCGRRWADRLFLIGILLFILADIHVGVYYLAAQVPTASTVTWYADHVAVFAMWMLYLPAQVLLTYSCAEPMEVQRGREQMESVKIQ